MDAQGPKVKRHRRLQRRGPPPTLGPVQGSRVVVVADAHLGQVPPATAAAFHAFLDAVPTLGDALLINGDLFDFWFEYKRVIPRKHFSTIAKLRALRERGVPIAFMGGNHDRWGGAFLKEDLGIEYWSGPTEIELAGRRALIHHGDGLTEQHWSGALTHAVLRNRVTIAVFGALHPTIGFWIADKLSGALADNTKDASVLDRAAIGQRVWATELLQRHTELGLVVLAHTHRPALEQLPGGRAYVNPGAFLDGGRYALVTRATVELKTFQP
jgi:UDP-2,3-diacylglucosamine hydrolase